jgi:SAM-dependent methyltransferase
MSSFNVYEDRRRAESYARLEFPGTYYLAFRDIPALLEKHGRGHDAVDFGCGAGRSTRFLRDLGYRVKGVDISDEMVRMAVGIDPDGDYFAIEDGELDCISQGSADVVLSAFTFDNIPSWEGKRRSLHAIKGVLKNDGIFINLVSSPELYRHEWASFTTQDFPENLEAKSGDIVRIVMTDVEDGRPVNDVLFPEESYRDVFACVGLEPVEVLRPLGKKDEPYDWISETEVAPWTIYVLKKRVV